MITNQVFLGDFGLELNQMELFRVGIVTTGQVHLLEIMPHMAHFKPRIVLIGSIIPPELVAVVYIFCVSCITEAHTNY
jgi:hypothetical protein